MTLEEVLQHPWIVKKNKALAGARRKSGDSTADQFKAFAGTDESLN